MGAVLSIPGQFWGRKRKKKGVRDLLAAAWAVPLLQEGQSCWKRVERGWMWPPTPSAPAHPSPQQRLRAWREPFGDLFVGRVLGGAPLFHARGLMQWGPEVLGWCRAKLRRVTARQGHRSLPPCATSACPRVPSSGVSPSPPLRGSAAQDARSLPALWGVWDFPAVPSGGLQGAKSAASQQPRWPRAPCAPRGEGGGHGRAGC